MHRQVYLCLTPSQERVKFEVIKQTSGPECTSFDNYRYLFIDGQDTRVGRKEGEEQRHNTEYKHYLSSSRSYIITVVVQLGNPRLRKRLDCQILY